MNDYVKNLKRIEFVITYACTGRCKHCSEGNRLGGSEHIDAEAAAKVVQTVADKFAIDSVMTFGGEPLLYPDAVFAIHSAAKEKNIPKRQLITNGYFSKDKAKIKEVAKGLADCGITDILLSADAFHQEIIPLEYVKEFAIQLKQLGVPLRVHPAWLVSKKDDNPYNLRTRRILAEFEALGIPEADGNIIFPSGNALKYLSEYFDMSKTYTSPYAENPTDIRAISIRPDGSVLSGNIYETEVTELLENYIPKLTN